MPATSPTDPISSASEPAPLLPLSCVRKAVAPCPPTNGQPQFTCKAKACPGTYRYKRQQAS